MFKKIFIATALLSLTISTSVFALGEDEKPKANIDIISETNCSYTVSKDLNARFEGYDNNCNVVILGIGLYNVINKDGTHYLEAPPYIKNGSTLVPVRFISESLNADVKWNADTEEVTISKDSDIIILKIGSNQASVNGKTKDVSVAVEKVNGRTFVPLRFVSESLNAKVYWNNKNQIIGIKG